MPLLLDVDGVINLLHGPFDGGWPPPGAIRLEAANHRRRVHELWVDERCPQWLAALGEVFEIVWATSWRNANEAISPLVGLPTNLRQVWFPHGWNDVPLELCTKTPWVRRFAADHGITSLAWIDDSAGRVDAEALERDWSGATPARAWQEVFTVTPALDSVFVVATDPSVGLTRAHVDALLDWHARARRPGCGQSS